MHQGGVAWMCEGTALGEAVTLGILAKCKGIYSEEAPFVHGPVLPLRECNAQNL